MQVSSLKDKVPPHNDDAEKATLGALLIDCEAIAIVLRYLREGDFYRNAHRKIFQAIVGLFQRGEAVDLITLTEELRKNNMLESCGGISYISSLTSFVPTSANVEYYARIVQGCSIRRTLLRIAREMIASAHDDSLEYRMVIEEAERKIFEITDRQQTSSFKAVREILPAAIDAIEKLYHNKDHYTGIPTGFSDLDHYTSGFQKSEFVVIGARPAVGKTALALSMASNMSIRNQIPVGFFTLEMADMALIQRLIASEARISSDQLRTGFLSPANFHDLTDAAGRIYEAPLYIDDTPNMKLLDLRAQARRMKSHHKIKIIFIDYITLIQSENKDLPRHEQIAEISRSLKALARELDIPVVALSQVRRETEGKRPSLADLRESGSIEQDADVVIFLHRDRGLEMDSESEVPNNIVTELILAKQRNGPVGTIKIAFLPKYTRFEPYTTISP
ncbi:MAG: replicative DNA helicase [Spirochaetes bacterium]|nr:MAG: replicative DNA helicase [Spirochaetota bacterium]